jgi:hypothetical protein
LHSMFGRGHAQRKKIEAHPDWYSQDALSAGALIADR